MKSIAKAALGVDISDGRVSLALIGHGAQGIELLKAGSCAAPDGAIKNGNVEDPTALSKVIRELRTHHRMPRTSRAGVSLPASSTVLQIMHVPKAMTSGIGRLVRNEVKSLVALSGKEVAFDFCRITSRRPQGSRLLAVAADARQVTRLVEACSKGSINPEVVEPPVLAYARVLYANQTQRNMNGNVLLAILRDSILTLCVFRKQNLDLVRTRNIGPIETELEGLSGRLAKEVKAVIQFYDVEIAEVSGEWNIVIDADSASLPNDTEQHLRDEIPWANLQVKTNENILQDILAVQDSGAEKPSVVAIGLAMRLLNIDGHNLKINLLPPESADIKSAKRHFLITSNIIAFILLLMIFAAVGIGMLAQKIEQKTTLRKQTELSQDTYVLLREQESLDKQIKQLSDRPARLKSILDSRYSADWAGILEDVKNLTPKTVRITRLYSDDNTNMLLNGVALSYEVVHLFVKMLDQSDHISSASLKETIREEKTGGLVKYVINCSLIRDEGQ
jgi:Tfp pilus assembly protein PilN